MSLKKVSVLHVYLIIRKDRKLVGRLALKNRKLFFEYDTEFIKSGLEISPFRMPLRPGVLRCDDPTFGELFGVFNDSLPDGWGRLLLDRKLRGLGLNPGELSALDRLSYVGSNGMGALAYMPEVEGATPPNHHDFDKFAEEVQLFSEKEDDSFIDELLSVNGSSAGARPKVVVRINDEDWIVKFRSSFDPKDIGPIEFAYHLMAKEAGLILPEAKLFTSKKGPGYFGAKRFDRNDNERIHMHTISGLLHSNHRLPSMTYEGILRATAILTKDIRETEKQFRAAAFNVFSHNRDDHTKNFSFLMDENGKWSVSPSYDLTFSSGPSGEHCTTIMEEGKNPRTDHLLKLSQSASLKKEKAINIIDKVKSAISKWEQFSKQAGVSDSSTEMIKKTLKNVSKN